jgi:hypothetical protein
MKAHLMHRDRDFDLEAPLPGRSEALVEDLELDVLLDAMAAGDEFLRDVARQALLQSLAEPEAVAYRQHVLGDCLEHPDAVRAFYDLSVEALVGERRIYGGAFRDAGRLLSRSVRALEVFAGALRRLRALADEHAPSVRSEGLRTLFALLADELDDAYLARVDEHLDTLRFKRGLLMSAQVGRGAKGRRHVVRRPHEQSLLERLDPRRSGRSFQIADRDEAGFKALGELRNRGVNEVANALAQSTDHIRAFFGMLRTELAFYVACLNLHERLAASTCCPEAVAGEDVLAARGLIDVALALTAGGAVGNDVEADGTALLLITGANQGGKSTFLRSVGQAQLMLQAGMFVVADSFRADLRTGLFTHFKREEDAELHSGKLDEELQRMSGIADAIGRGGMLLCNESFAATNEREGSEIARQVTGAMVEARVKVCFVTHLYDFSHGLYADGRADAMFLRAGRERTFRLEPGEPLPTSYGADAYRRIFGGSRDEARSPP